VAATEQFGAAKAVTGGPLITRRHCVHMIRGFRCRAPRRAGKTELRLGGRAGGKHHADAFPWRAFTCLVLGRERPRRGSGPVSPRRRRRLQRTACWGAIVKSLTGGRVRRTLQMAGAVLDLFLHGRLGRGLGQPSGPAAAGRRRQGWLNSLRRRVLSARRRHLQLQPQFPRQRQPERGSSPVLPSPQPALRVPRGTIPAVRFESRRHRR